MLPKREKGKKVKLMLILCDGIYFKNNLFCDEIHPLVMMKTMTMMME
jgi:hypothetical protein